MIFLHCLKSVLQSLRVLFASSQMISLRSVNVLKYNLTIILLKVKNEDDSKAKGERTLRYSA